MTRCNRHQTKLNMSASGSSDEASELVGWIRLHGGTVHDALEVRTPIAGGDDGRSSPAAARSCRRRGVFARRPIRRGDELVRLPRRLALDGRANPSSYDWAPPDGAERKRSASPWLRCLASLVAALADSRGGAAEEGGGSDGATGGKSAGPVDHGPYVSSLPGHYDSLLNWTPDEVDTYLRGTSLAASCGGGEAALRDRFDGTVLPYLRFVDAGGRTGADGGRRDAKRRRKDDPSKGCNEDRRKASADDLFPLFREACMCISTRAFHMQSLPGEDGKEGGKDKADDSTYDGPFLLPYVDLLNHAPSGSWSQVTTLRRDDRTGDFVMAAERDVEVGEEVCHSYGGPGGGDGTGLNSAQLLRTFGFVDVGSVSARLEAYHRPGVPPDGGGIRREVPPGLTPAVISRDDVLSACEEVAASSRPGRIREHMERTGMLDDGWECWPVPDGVGGDGGEDRSGNGLRRRLLDGLPGDFIVSSSDPLTDELITACALRFLPDEALEDLAGGGDGEGGPDRPPPPLLLGRDVLSDYYLGSLVLGSVLGAVRARLSSYAAGGPDGRGGTAAWGTDAADDSSLLSGAAAALAEGGADGRGMGEEDGSLDRLAFGLAVSLEERTCLLGLRGAASDMLAALDDGG